MSSFDEMEKQVGSASPFKRSFFEGMTAGMAVFVLLFGWMVFRADDTAHKLQDLIPAKTVSLDRTELKKGEAQGLISQSAGQTVALPPAPIEGLEENVEGKTLPLTRIRDDMTPFEAYKRPFKPTVGRAVVSIVIVDFGLSELLSKSVLDNMPPDISLVLNPYTAEPSKWAALSRSAGHEFWLSLPMQTKDPGQDDSGPKKLLLSAPVEENRKMLFEIMGAVTGYAGLVSQKDHVFVKSDLDVSPIMTQIFGRGLAFAESNPDIPAFGLSMAMESGYPYVQNTFWLDNDLRPSAIDAALQEMELQAMKKGKVVAFVHPYPVVINKIKEWVKAANEKGIDVAPLSALVQ